MARSNEGKSSSPPGTPASTARTLPTPISRTQTSTDEHPTSSSLKEKDTGARPSAPTTQSTHATHDPHTKLADDAAGAVEDTDEKANMHDPEELTKDWEVDPENPRNWSPGRKWAMAGCVSFYTFSTRELYDGARIARDSSQTLAFADTTVIGLTLSIYLLAYALGPLVLAPLSEMYGRTWVLHISNFVFIIFTIACAVAPNTASLIIFRFISGLGGSAPLAIGAGSITDLFAEEGRAAAMGIFTLGPLIGPVVGPVAGGFVAQHLSYHWIFWIIAILAGAASALGIPILRETYAPVILRRRAKKLGKEVKSPHSLGEILWLNLTRPITLLTRSFICFIFSLYMAVIYGIMYLLFVTFPLLYGEVYGWKAGVAGLAYLGPGIGFLVGVMFAGRNVDSIYAKLKERNNGVGQPEFRIPVMFVGSFIVPIGLFWYGWTADKGLHWILPIIGSGIFGAGMMMCFLPIQVYLVDTFTYAASAVAAATLLRSLFGFVFPLFAERIFTALGVGGGYSLVAGISIVVGWPFPVLIYFKGAAMRARSDLTR
ncbi:hypothetical protein FRC04_008827 [Tulasnella sp. 424]|nr:hypothetical protein FRC04_008827 [Tulasnella sp. 424]